MKRKNRALIIIPAIAAAFAVFTAMSLTGCDNNTAHTHDFGAAWKSDATHHWHECEADGERSGEAAHDWDWVETTPATTEAAGLETQTCTVCKKESGETQPIPKLTETPGTCDNPECECDPCEGEGCDCGEPITPPPTANAGTDQTATLADNLTVTLNGSASTGSITAYAWQCKSYTADQGTVNQAYTTAEVTALIANANTMAATVTPRKAGTYIFTLTLTGSGGTDSADVKVVVEGYTVPETVTLTFPNYTSGGTTINFKPINLPSEVTYTLEDDLDNVWNSANGFNGVVDIDDGPYEIFTTPAFTQIFYQNSEELCRQVIKVDVIVGTFEILNDANGTAFENQAIPSVDVTFEKTITELPPDEPPVTPPPAANAGTDQTATLADNLTVTLNGSASTGSITAYAWQCKSYTADQGTVNQAYTTAEVTALIANANAPTATVAPRKAGTYIFTLTLTGSGGTDSAEVKVVVEPMELTKDITVPAITAVTNPMNFGTVPALENGWDSNFPASDVTYTLTLSQGGTTKVTNNGPTISASGQTSGMYTLTQTFYYNGNSVGSRSVGIEVNGNTFVPGLCISETDYTDANLLAITLSLSKDITELP